MGRSRWYGQEKLLGMPAPHMPQIRKTRLELLETCHIIRQVFFSSTPIPAPKNIFYVRNIIATLFVRAFLLLGDQA